MLDVLFAILLVVLGGLVSPAIRLAQGRRLEKRQESRLRSELATLESVVSDAIRQRDWESPFLDSHVASVLALLRERDFLALLRTPKLRQELMDLYSTLQWLADAQRQLKETDPGHPEPVDPIVALRLSENSPLKMVDKLKAAKEHFDTVADMAEAGNVSALRQLPSTASLLLRIVREYTGGAAVRNEFQHIVDRLARARDLAPGVVFHRVLQQIRICNSLLSP